MMKVLKLCICWAALGILFAVPAGASPAEERASTPITMETIVVTGTKTEHKLEDVPVQTYVISRQDIERSSATTISDLLSKIPGFNFSQQSNLPASMGYKNTVRGLNVESRYLLVLVDGQRVFTGYRAGGMASPGFSHNVNAVPLELIDHVEVVTGPGSALYGSDAMVGVLNIITKKTDAPTTAGVSYGWYTVAGHNYMHEKPEHPNRTMMEAHALVSGSLSDTVKGMLFINHQENDGVQPDKYDVQLNNVTGKIDLDLSPSLQVRLGGEYNYWEEKNDVRTDVKEERSPRLFASIDFSPGEEHKLSLNAYTQRLKADFRDRVNYGDRHATVGYEAVDLQYAFSGLDNLLVILGGEFLQETFKASSMSGKKSIDTKSIYTQAEWKLFNGTLTLVPGVRFDSNDSYGDELNPKFSLMYRPIDDTTFRASVARSFKAPMATQTHADPFNHGYAWILANPNLKPEKAITYQFGVDQWLFDRKALIAATYFDMSLTDMITMANKTGGYQGTPAMTYSNVEKAKIRGIESTLGLFFTENWDLTSSYTYLHAKNKTKNERLPDTPQNILSATLSYTNEEIGFGGSVFGTYTDAQKNIVHIPNFTPEETKQFTSFGLTAWKSIGEHFKVKAAAGNIFNERLSGSDTIHVGRTVSLGIECQF